MIVTLLAFCASGRTSAADSGTLRVGSVWPEARRPDLRFAAQITQAQLQGNAPLPDAFQVAVPAGVSVAIVAGAQTVTLFSGSYRFQKIGTHENVACVAACKAALNDPRGFYTVSAHGVDAAAEDPVYTVEADEHGVTVSCSAGRVNATSTATVFIKDSGSEVPNVREIDVIGPNDAKYYSFTEGQYIKSFGTLVGAVQYYKDRLAEAQHSGDPDRIETALDALSRVEGDSGDYKSEEEHARDALKLAQQRFTGDNADVANEYSTLAAALNSNDEDAQALSMAQASVAMWNRLDPAGTQKGHAWALGSEADVFMDLGRFERAIDAYTQELKIFRAAENKPGRGDVVALERLGNAYYSIDTQKELGYVLQALSVAKNLGGANATTPTVARLLQQVSIAYGNTDNPDLALSYAQRAYDAWLHLLGTEKAEKVVGQGIRPLILAYIDKQDYVKALALTQHAISILDVLPNVPAEDDYEMYWELGEIDSHLHDDDAEKQAYLKALSYAKELEGHGNPAENRETYAELSGIANGLHDDDASIRYAQMELATAKEMSDAPDELVWAYEDVARTQWNLSSREPSYLAQAEANYQSAANLATSEHLDARTVLVADESLGREAADAADYLTAAKGEELAYGAATAAGGAWPNDVYDDGVRYVAPRIFAGGIQALDANDLDRARSLYSLALDLVTLGGRNASSLNHLGPLDTGTVELAFRDLADADVKAHQPQRVATDLARIDALLPEAVELQLALGEGALYSGDADSAASVFLRYHDRPIQVSATPVIFDDAGDVLIKAIDAYRTGGVDVAQSSEIEAMLKGNGAARDRLASAFRSDSPSAKTEFVDDAEALADEDILNGAPADAVRIAQAGLQVDATNPLLLLRLAHAYLYSNDLASAKPLYLRIRDARYGDSGETFAAIALADFTRYRQHGVDSPNVPAIQSLLSGTGAPLWH
ncbi:MAG TPA: tetratricopeptide repeat protein [Candidatus Baltobacteraceae bacterium]|nr:tetratricopeptide repeat protein [Candidatus Baltobacteraceae bacterium]